MGAPVSPMLAYVVMLELIDFVTKNLTIKLPLLQLYIDDTLLLIPDDKIDIVLETFDTFNRHEKLHMMLKVKKNRYHFWIL